MALTVGQLLAPPGGATNVGAVKQGSNVAISGDGTISNTSAAGVNSIIAGSNISIDQSTGVVTISWTGSGGGDSEDNFPAGYRLVFVQASAPTGWSRDNVDQTALRLVSGSGGGTGGSNNFTSAFSNQTVSGSINASATWSNSGTDGTDVIFTGQGNNLIVTNSQDYSIGGNEAPSHNHDVNGMFDTKPNSNSFNLDGGAFGVNALQISSAANNNGGHNHTISYSPLFVNSSGGNHGHPLSVPGNISGSVSGSTLALGVKYKDSLVCTKQ